MNIGELLKDKAKNCPQKKAVLFQDRTVTFRELKETSFKLANYLLSLGIRQEDKVAMFLPNGLEALFTFLGVFSAQAAIVPLDFMLTESEIINFINHSQAKVLVIHPKKELNLLNIKSKCKSLKEIIVCLENSESFSTWDSALTQGNSDEISLKHNERGLCSIFYTSGSTGHPKGVSLEFRHLDNSPKTIDRFLGISGEDRFLCGGVPFSHIGGLGYILLMIYFSSPLILMERFHPLEFLRNIERHKVTIFCIVPAMYVAILGLKEYEKFDLSSLRFAVVFGAPSSPLLLERFHKLCPNAVVLNGWGMTETAAPNTFSPPDEAKISSIGSFDSKMEAKIVNEAGESVSRGKKGELWVKGEAIMRGYFKEPALTQEVLTQDRWLKTGDIVKQDQEGLYYIVGRKKDMIKVAGEIVSPAEVEEKIQEHPKVKEVAIIGVADNLRGEVPKAFIVTRQQASLDADEIKDFLKERIAHFKVPHHFEFVEDLPKNRTGKIDKQKLVKGGA
ncbi:MAG: class I adenylate-forming enzyme family protein [Candidatus Omnitrophota bacterium]